MGVDFFPCDNCGETICDSGDYDSFNIDDYEESYTVCDNCSEEVRSMLKPSRDPNYLFCLRDKKTDKRFLFKTKAKLVEFTIENNQADYSYGIITQRKLKSPVEKSFLGDPNCGMKDTEVLEELHKISQKVENEQNLMLSLGNNNTAYIGWKGFALDNTNGFCSSKKYDSLVIYNIVSVESRQNITPDQAFEKIKNFEKRHNLVGVPMLVTAYGNEPKYHPSILRDFCFPDLSVDIRWFNSLRELNQDLNRLIKSRDVDWRCTKDFIEYKTSQIDRKISELQEEKNRLLSISLEDKNESQSDQSDEE